MQMSKWVCNQCKDVPPSATQRLQPKEPCTVRMPYQEYHYTPYFCPTGMNCGKWTLVEIEPEQAEPLVFKYEDI